MFKIRRIEENTAIKLTFLSELELELELELDLDFVKFARVVSKQRK